jgi:hypothetical protein
LSHEEKGKSKRISLLRAMVVANVAQTVKFLHIHKAGYSLGIQVSACLACVRPWVLSQHHNKKKNKKA